MTGTTRYAFVGTGHRAQLYFDALLGPYADVAEPVALCDTNPTRMAYYQRLRGGEPLPTFAPEEYLAMLDRVRPDGVVVTSVDDTHADYVVAALERGVDVIVEKPLTVDEPSCARIADAARRSTARLVVTFNYRYSPRNSAVKALLLDGVIGTPTAVHFEWVLDTVHGADYFRRWHRDKARSGGLFVHKATHHFDLVNWWLADRPSVVTAHGGLRFYGPGGDHDTDAFVLDLSADVRLHALYADAARHDGYRRDQDVFSPGITIEDTMAALVRYESGALLTYSLTAYGPWEGYRVSITGTRGRIELAVCERSSVPPGRAADVVGWHRDAPDLPEGARPVGTRLLLQRHWEAAEEVPVDAAAGTHGGGDARLLDDLFRPGAAPDPLGRAADYRDGVLSVLVGAAANASLARGGASVLVVPPW
ncbi:Gfo/Idh/MocA family protein [Actinokineospora sp. UTMC 2448]|uniref:Gfo/Idh/MocA family protein n=1 Tax=Actinokineospora sp. UTMC 2448 TaxID=2268449 RepID=UPI002164462C|nr:Gfo/Idh/MocA family oxidoreductase [Actinokineospora sp. UTMC 2448]UVS78927.1 Putative oxidoreductase YteT precursor [Actinokineospora sp. UTMC 2448]